MSDTQPKKSSRVSQFLLNPYSTVKIVAPTVAIAAVLHKTTIKDTSLRGLTLGLTLLHSFWFATTLNLSYIETPLLANVPSLDEWKKLDVGRHRFSLISKIETVASVLSASLFFNWHHRIIVNNGFVDNMLKAVAIAPVAITILQSTLFLPKFFNDAKKVEQGESTTQELWEKDPYFLKRHRGYIALDTIKIASLGLAGWKFGKMLEN